MDPQYGNAPFDKGSYLDWLGAWYSCTSPRHCIEVHKLQCVSNVSAYEHTDTRAWSLASDGNNRPHSISTAPTTLDRLTVGGVIIRMSGFHNAQGSM
jgi:hypothetical protein